MPDERREALVGLNTTLYRVLHEWREELSPDEIDCMYELRGLLGERFQKENEQAKEADPC